VINPLFELERAIAHLRFNPKPEDERLEELRQQCETVLTLLESEFLGAILSGDWSEFDQFLNDFRGQASTKDLSRPGADSLQRPTEPIVQD
jgi:hypothetical protein